MFISEVLVGSQTWHGPSFCRVCLAAVHNKEGVMFLLPVKNYKRALKL
jgi:hypothetical protein